MKLYHATTIKKSRLYKNTGYIIKPVRGFTTLQAAMAWAIKIEGRRVLFYEIETEDFTDKSNVYKLPDHHNKFGQAWWIDYDVPYDSIKCVFNADD